MAENKKLIEEAQTFCNDMELEIRVRNTIAEITKKLNRSNLSANEGMQCAELLKKAYAHLEDVEKAIYGVTQVQEECE